MGNKVGGGGLVLAGILIIFLGVLIRWDFLKDVIDFIGIIIIIGGAAVGIIGLIKVFSGGNGGGSSNDF